jgi:hypothetical protein
MWQIALRSTIFVSQVKISLKIRLLDYAGGGMRGRSGGARAV